MRHKRKSPLSADFSFGEYSTSLHTCEDSADSPYVIQRAAEAALSPEGRAQTKLAIDYYLNNAKVIREGLTAAGLTVYGGVNAPYLWVKTPGGAPSWDFFDLLLKRACVVTTPGAGFGPSGEGYIRITAFGDADATKEAVQRIVSVLK